MYNEKELLKIENKFVAIVSNIFYQKYLNNSTLSFDNYKPQLNKISKQYLDLAKNDAVYYIGKEYYSNIAFAAEDTESEILTEYLIAYFFFFSDNLDDSISKYADVNNISKIEAFNLIGNTKLTGYLRTASNDMYNQLLLKTYNKAGVEYFRFVAVLDSRTSDICRYMNGKIFTKYNIAAYIPPLHPYCRSRIVPIKKENVNKSKIFSSMPESLLKTFNWFKNAYSIDLQDFKIYLNTLK